MGISEVLFDQEDLTMQGHSDIPVPFWNIVSTYVRLDVVEDHALYFMSVLVWI